ncbi:hypothetical protein CDAR_590141 [Caerostris darwini]|uniref:Uncharacterized protein n=1 Tax=Caerostris darwini TaxID=1538125 RepID=A0AAV4NPI8_9ARAC|nr:hypothetical protein CDAR_590141 [Caerostris darwini]
MDTDIVVNPETSTVSSQNLNEKYSVLVGCLAFKFEKNYCRKKIIIAAKILNWATLPRADILSLPRLKLSHLTHITVVSEFYKSRMINSNLSFASMLQRNVPEGRVTKECSNGDDKSIACPH